MKEQNRVFANNLNRCMATRGITRTQLSDVLNTPYTTICNWCLGNAFPRIDALDALANILGVTRSDLVDPPVNRKELEQKAQIQLIAARMNEQSLFRSLIYDIHTLSEKNLSLLRGVVALMKEVETK